MTIKTLNRKDAVHILNMVSIVMAWGVTSYFFDSVVNSSTVRVLGEILMTPVVFTDKFLSLYTHISVSGNFTLMFLVLWISYALPLTKCYPFLIVKSHNAEELHSWYLSRGIKS